MEKKMNARKKAQRAARLRKQRNRRIALTLCLMFVVAFASIGGTIAWLTAQSGEVTNTFTVGDINIELKEHDYVPESKTLNSEEVDQNVDYKLVPGDTLPKDPFVRVRAESEDCYLFVEVVEVNGVDTYINYTLDSTKWKKVENVTPKHTNGVVYKYINATTENKVLFDDEDQTISILTSNQVTVDANVTKAQLDAIDSANLPKITFYAYAVQSANVAEAEAWSKIS